MWKETLNPASALSIPVTLSRVCQMIWNMVATQVNFEKLFRDSEKSYLFLLTDARGKRRGWGEGSTGLAFRSTSMFRWSGEMGLKNSSLLAAGATAPFGRGAWSSFLSPLFARPRKQIDGRKGQVSERVSQFFWGIRNVLNSPWKSKGTTREKECSSVGAPVVASSFPNGLRLARRVSLLR